MDPFSVSRNKHTDLGTVFDRELKHAGRSHDIINSSLAGYLPRNKFENATTLRCHHSAEGGSNTT